MKHWGGIFLICLALCACSTDKKVAPSEGRLSLMEETSLKASSGKPAFDKAKSPSSFLTAGENAQNKKSPLSFKETKEDWTTDAGSFNGKFPLNLNKILIDEKNIYTMDDEGLFSQFGLKGNEIFSQQIIQDKDVLTFTSKNGQFFTLTTEGNLLKTDKKGKILWKKDLNVPFRNEPVLYKDIIYLLSADNNLWALNINNAKEVWHYKTTAPTTALWKMGRPAVNNNIIIVPFSNGLVSAFQAQTGTFLWETDMMGNKSFNQISDMTQMSASPVIEKDTVYLVGHADITKAVNLKDGEELWTLPIGGNTTPFLNGNTLFVLDNQNVLHALNKKNGQQFWVTKLPKTQQIPVLNFVNNTLVVFYPDKTFLITPKTGEIKSSFENDKKVASPVITKKGLYFLTDNGQLNYQGFLQ